MDLCRRHPPNLPLPNLLSLAGGASAGSDAGAASSPVAEGPCAAEVTPASGYPLPLHADGLDYCLSTPRLWCCHTAVALQESTGGTSESSGFMLMLGTAGLIPVQLSSDATALVVTREARMERPPVIRGAGWPRTALVLFRGRHCGLGARRPLVSGPVTPPESRRQEQARHRLLGQALTSKRREGAVQPACSRLRQEGGLEWLEAHRLTERHPAWAVDPDWPDPGRPGTDVAVYSAGRPGASRYPMV